MRKEKYLEMTLSEEGSEVLSVICGREEHKEVQKRPSVLRALGKGNMVIVSLTVLIFKRPVELMPAEICRVVNSKVNKPIHLDPVFFLICIITVATSLEYYRY